MKVRAYHGDRISIQGPTQWDIQLELKIQHEDGALWDRDIRDELPTNPNPTNPPVWWRRSLDRINILTLHHTLSDSPHVTFRNYIRTKKRPTGPYTFWITQTGEVLLCVDPEWGNWHDHTGFGVEQNGRRLWGNSHLSVGMAGRLHEYLPAEVQLERTAQFIADIIKSDLFPMIDGEDRVKGHMDFIGTECPGWWKVRGGKRIPDGDRWETRLYDMIKERR